MDTIIFASNSPIWYSAVINFTRSNPHNGSTLVTCCGWALCSDLWKSQVELFWAVHSRPASSRVGDCLRRKTFYWKPICSLKPCYLKTVWQHTQTCFILKNEYIRSMGKKPTPFPFSYHDWPDILVPSPASSTKIHIKTWMVWYPKASLDKLSYQKDDALEVGVRVGN